MRLAYLLSAIQVVKAVINVNVSAQYDFTQKQCTDGVIPDVIGDGIYGDLVLDETASCLDRVGVQTSGLIGGTPAATSLGNSSGLLKVLREPDVFPGFAIEIWISLGTDLDPDDPCETYWTECEYVIVSFNSNTLGPTMDKCKYTTDFQIVYHPYFNSFSAYWRTDSDFCSRYEASSTPVSQKNLQYPFQLVFTTGDVVYTSGRKTAVLFFFLNGSHLYDQWAFSIYGESGTNELQHWHEGYTLQLLDKVRYNTSEYFEKRSTTLYKVRIFSERVAITGEYETVAALFAEGIAQSDPAPYNVTAEINEDGEAGDHYYDPGLYLQEFAVTELQHIYLDIYDSDNDPTTLNYDVDNETLPRAFISVLPHKGHIFDPRSGEVVVSTPYEVLREKGVFPVTYRPLLNEYSSSSNISDPYTTFSYYAEDGTTGGRSVENATVHVYVVPKNDPPRASNLTLNALAATRENIFNLLQGGSDVDGSDEVQGAIIGEVPQNGTLYQGEPPLPPGNTGTLIHDNIVATGELHHSPYTFALQVYADGRASPTTFSAGERVWTGQNIAYRFNISILRSNLPSNQIVGTDSFTYRVYDLDQNCSLPATINVVVYTGVSALGGDGRWQCYEEEDCEISLYGEAISESLPNMWFTITGVPMYGSLIDARNGDSVQIGSVLSKRVSYPYEDGVLLLYRPSIDFFNDPNITWTGIPLPEGNTEVITFYASVREGDAVLSSATADQSILVTNVDDETRIACLEGYTYEVMATQTVTEFNATDQRPDRLIVANISLSEVDKNVDPVRVDIEIDTGAVTLNSEYRDRLSFYIGCSGGSTTWYCWSDPILQNKMTFIGTPSDVENSLNGMTYLNGYRYANDNFSITVYHGSGGGSCMSSKGFTTTSVRSEECVISSCKMQVKVGSYYYEPSAEDSDGALITISLKTMSYFFIAAISTFTLLIFRLSYKLFVVFFRSLFCCFNFGRKKTKKGEAGKSEDNEGKDDKDKDTDGASRGHGVSGSRKDGHRKERASAGKKSTGKKSTKKKSTSKKSTNRTTKKGASSRRSHDTPVKVVKAPRRWERAGHAPVVPIITSQQHQPPANGRDQVSDIEQNWES